MPELPEVESLRLELNKSCAGQTIKNVELRRANLRYAFQGDLSQRILNKSILSVDRRAKFIVFNLDDSSKLVSHLGMTGSWTWMVDGSKVNLKKHDHIRIDLEHGALVYNDPRRFGHLLHCQNLIDVKTPFHLDELGVEPLHEDFKAEVFLALRRRRPKASIKSVLMDQKVVVGVGNIYASEALFLAKVRPSRSLQSIKILEAAAIVKGVRTVLVAGIEAGGTTFRDYRGLTENKGEYQIRLMVYGRDGQKCKSCRALIRQKRIAGRSTFWCPKCQK